MATKYLDEDGVQALWSKVRGYAPGVSESNTFTGTNVFNGDTSINQYPVLVAKPHSGYNHTIRQYQYEDYLDFTDNSLDGEYRRTIMQLNGNNGVVEFPHGILVEGVNILEGRCISIKNSATLKYIVSTRIPVDISGNWTAQINGTGDTGQKIHVILNDGSTTTYTRVLWATYSHADSGKTLFRVHDTTSTSDTGKLYSDKEPDEIYIESTDFPFHVSIAAEQDILK